MDSYCGIIGCEGTYILAHIRDRISRHFNNVLGLYKRIPYSTFQPLHATIAIAVAWPLLALFSVFPT